MSTVLVIDDDRGTLHMIQQTFLDTGVEVITARTAGEGLELIAQKHPDLVLLDVMLPDIQGIEAFQSIKRVDPRLPVIFITAGGSSDTAIEAVKVGAFDYLLKPLDLDRVRELVTQALEMRRRMNVQVKLPGAPQDQDTELDDRMVGRSPQILEVYKSIGRVASQDVTVLIRGESGTGKELIARAIYQHSQRSRAPFLAVNCAAIPDALLESELFGHEKGSFTGADRQRIGKFEQCSGGTIFLDEVGDMSPLVQGKLLRLLQEQRFERVGGNQTIQTDVRIIAATHRDLEAMANEGTFRSDLYYRLNGFTISIPPLRERGDDIVLLLERIFSVYAQQLGKDVQGIAPDALKLLVEYPWPGNVREMQSAVRRALLQTTGPVLLADSLPDEIRTGFRRGSSEASANGPSGNLERLIDTRLQAHSTDLYAETLAAMELCLLTRVLKLTGGNQSQAARILGITRGSLRNKIHALKIHIGSVVLLDEEPAETPQEEVLS
ncbi:MAG: sigma-54-dependent Fis family transcriptional regulator [Planctomycetia bacterium]|nr:sigma-54-dependent Fis family transcriptional regulator [Planctomycetia bacterium]